MRSHKSHGQTIIRDLDTKAGQCFAFLEASNDYRRNRASGLSNDRDKYIAAREEMKKLILKDPDRAEALGRRVCKEIRVTE